MGRRTPGGRLRSVHRSQQRADRLGRGLVPDAPDIVVPALDAARFGQLTQVLVDHGDSSSVQTAPQGGSGEPASHLSKANKQAPKAASCATPWRAEKFARRCSRAPSPRVQSAASTWSPTTL